MGRTVITTDTTRSVITNNLATTLTTVYTNSTGVGSELRAVNINGIGNANNFNTSTGSSEWTHFGSAINPFNQGAGASSTGFGHPYPVQLSDTRVLIFFLPHFQHRGGDGQDFFDGDKIHCQILEYQTNRYVAGPITTVGLPSVPFSDTSLSLWSRPGALSGSWGNNGFKAVALTATKVVVAYRLRSQFRLVRLTITGNSVDFTTAQLDLTGGSFFNSTQSSAFAIDTVPGNTNKVVIGGWASTNYSLQAYNVPDVGVLSAATALVSTGISSAANYHFGMSRMVTTATANVTPYIIAAATSATASTAVIFNYNSSTDVFTVSGLTVSLPAVSSEFSGLECACMSNGTDVNAVIALTGTGAGQTITFCRQTSSAGATSTSTSLTLQHTSTKAITEHFQWGNQRVVFVGDSGLLVVYDSAGSATNLLPATETTNTTRYQQQWIPFNTRPLYNLYDPGTIFTERVHQWVARTTTGAATSTVSATGTAVGVSTLVGNYFPFGHDYGIGYAWNEPANCWVVGQNGRLYTLDVNGVIQSEISIYNLSTALNWEYAVRQVACTPSGRILFVADYRNGIVPDVSMNCWNTWNNFTSATLCCSTTPLAAANELGRISLEFGPTNISTRLSCNLVTFIEGNTARTERALLMTMNSSATIRPQWHTWTAGSGWTNLGTISYNTADHSNGWMRGFRPNLRVIQDTPTSTVFPRGLWRVLGSRRLDGSGTYRQGGIGNPTDINSPSGTDPESNVFDSTNTNTFGYAIGYSQYASGSRFGIQVAAMYDQTRGVNRIWSSINGRLNAVRGQFDLTLNNDINRRYAQPVATKFGYSVVFQNTNTAANTAIAQVWDIFNIITPRFTLTTASGNGWMTAYPTGKISWQHFGASVDTIYTVSGIPDDVRFFLVLDDNAGTTFTLNNGQLLSMITTDTSLFRSTDLYTIPNGFSLRVRCDTPFSLATLLSIVENA